MVDDANKASENLPIQGSLADLCCVHECLTGSL